MLCYDKDNFDWCIKIMLFQFSGGITVRFSSSIIIFDFDQWHNKFFVICCVIFYTVFVSQ